MLARLFETGPQPHPKQRGIEQQTPCCAQTEPTVAPETDSLPGYRLNITVLYHGKTARVEAEEVVAQAAAAVGERCVSPAWWDLERLSEPLARSEAFWGVALADILIVSLSGGDLLPVGFHDWVMQAAMLRLERKTLLVALLGQQQGSSDASAAMRLYLEALATSSGMSFLLRDPRQGLAGLLRVPEPVAA
jgi:hypothetical protein